jgi:hypothetical protein
MNRCVLLVASVLAAAGGAAWPQEGYDSPFAYDDPKPQAYVLSERASIIDPRVGSHPEINFPLEKDGRPRDVESAHVDTRVKPRGKLVLALTGGGQLFKLTKELGMHAIHVPYADGWFSLIRSGTPAQTWRGDVRLEAATGEDFSPLVDIPKPDGLAERSRQFVKWLARRHPQGRWDSFLTRDGDDLRWEDVILVGLSHGSTTAARFAQHKKLDRVLCFSGPRDQDQSWQSGPSATPANRYFMFTGADGGWDAKHYCRSWELLGLHELGPIVDVEQTQPPYENTRRLFTSIAKTGDKRVHNAVAPNDAAFKDESGRYIHEPVWRYMLTHPVDRVGTATPRDPDCQVRN